MPAPESVSVGAEVLIVEDYLPWGYPVNEWILGNNGIAYDVISSSMLAATNLKKYRLLILPSVQPTSTYQTVAADSAQIAAFVNGGVHKALTVKGKAAV